MVQTTSSRLPPNASEAEWIASLPPAQRAKRLKELAPTPIDERALEYEWPFWARKNQLAPAGKWLVWLVLAGRGWGKTKTGAEWIRSRVRNPRARIALVGPTASDVRDVMIEGESGIMASSPPWDRPIYEPSKRRLTWKNGAVATAFSGEEPDRLRGPQHTDAWADELAAWKYPDTWDQLMFGLRLGQDPRVLVTTTPRPIPIVKQLLGDPTTRITRGSTFDNRANLADAFIDKIRKKYEGTRLGRQELFAEVLDDTPGALWTLSRIEALRVRKPPALKRIVIAIDPAVTSEEESAETGIVAVGLGEDDEGYVLADGSGKFSPDGWARAGVDAYRDWEADRIVAEVNNGGDLVETVVRTVDANVPYTAVRASRGKRTRAEPIAALYEQGRVHHVGVHKDLEDQMTTWDASSGAKSPDRMDALVWGLTELMLGGEAGDFDAELLKKMPKRRQ